MDKSKKIGFAVIGYGGMGSWHASTCADDFKDTAELIGIYDIKPERRAAAEAEGIHAFSSREELLADERIDLVTVATPNDVHKEIAIAAMAAGKNVISEKPVALSQEELEEMIAASKKYDKLFTVHQNRRWDPDFKCVQKILADNELGKVFRIESRVQGSRGIPGDWRGIKEKGGGMMFDWGVHLLDRIVLMVPEKIKKVYAKMTHVTNDEVDDGFIMNMVFESGITATVEVGTCNFITLPHWYLCGDQGTAEIKDFRDPGRMVVLRSWEDKDATPILMGEGLSKTMAPRNPDSVDELPLPDFSYDRNELYSNVCDVVMGKAEQIVKNEEALRVLRLMEAALESDEKGIVVDFE